MDSSHRGLYATGFVSTQLGSTQRMVGKMFMWPLRVGVRVGQVWLRASGEALGLAITVADRALGRPRAEPVEPAARQPSRLEAQSPAREAPARRPTTPTQEPPAPLPTVGRGEEEPAPISEGPERAHVSEEPELVEEAAEPGAEDGAGAEVHIREPWKGYAHAGAEEVISRLADATPAEVAAVQLYERTNRSRRTVLAAAERELRAASGGGSPTPERGR
jgi:hypothetical protein